MLSEQERHEIAAQSHHYPNNRALCIEALKIVQAHRGWVSDEGIADVAEALQMAAAELEGVATFYNMIFRKPVGRHVILLCDSVSCWIMGYDGLREHLHARLGIGLGETTADGCFTLLPNVCLGACDHAPAMMIDSAHYQDLDPAGIDEILAKYQMNEIREEKKEKREPPDGNTADS
ncbi:NADH-quinone oxidoreductase subunit NuoE [Nitrosospira sp. NRS527]|uniref:NADH-quinone oxidoreductase subunit NuoE n=1 Tax=Nitrosospira sp. NRS527 TaxID=155925 RepID=UPI001AF4FCEB|nr:NADH-quinone oxidoreductase subunit NuoE [Nitrosospira sp. NRS527]BCT67304.1 NADH-quinone oxidoreductase subunit E [Nitrosospira sp. NRS527]